MMMNEPTHIGGIYQRKEVLYVTFKTALRVNWIRNRVTSTAVQQSKNAKEMGIPTSKQAETAIRIKI